MHRNVHRGSELSSPIGRISKLCYRISFNFLMPSFRFPQKCCLCLYSREAFPLPGKRTKQTVDVVQDASENSPPVPGSTPPPRLHEFGDPSGPIGPVNPGPVVRWKPCLCVPVPAFRHPHPHIPSYLTGFTAMTNLVKSAPQTGLGLVASWHTGAQYGGSSVVTPTPATGGPAGLS